MPNMQIAGKMVSKLAAKRVAKGALKGVPKVAKKIPITSKINFLTPATPQRWKKSLIDKAHRGGVVKKSFARHGEVEREGSKIDLKQWFTKKYNIPIKEVGAGIGAAFILQSEKVEAMPAGVIKKIASKAAKGVVSSTSNRLKGRTLQGKTIKAITKGKGNWRSIQFTDDTEMIVEKHFLNDLARQKGTQKYIKEFKTKKGATKRFQAEESLKYHKARQQAFATRQGDRTIHQGHLTRSAKLGKELPQDTHFVTHEGSFFQMPAEYAEYLEKLGILKIMKSKRDLRAIKPKRVVKKKK